MVKDDDAVDAVLSGPEGVLAGLEAGAVVVDMSTTSVGSKRSSAELVREARGRFVDSPVFGSRPQAEQRTLKAVAGAEPDDLEAARPFLEPLTDRIFHVGEVGAGAAVKLAGNLVLFSMMSGLAEGIALTQAYEVEPARLLEAIQSTAFGSAYYELKGTQMIEGDFAPRFAIDNAVKDLRLIAAAGEEAGVHLVGTQAVAEAFQAAAAAGFGAEDMAALVKAVRR
jgi:3-hydroxyisobutyrate dehydrogenase-like beta-hydroxyacid dehydrogenase